MLVRPQEADCPVWSAIPLSGNIFHVAMNEAMQYTPMSICIVTLSGMVENQFASTLTKIMVTNRRHFSRGAKMAGFSIKPQIRKKLNVSQKP